MKLILFTIGFIIFSIPALFGVYNDFLLNPTLSILLHHPQYPPITISIDPDFGIPHIFSETLEGSLFGLGYMHAKDRLFQMQIKRLVAYGRLAEMFGKEVMFLDKFFRTLGLKEICEKNWEGVQKNSPETAMNIIAYADGINEFMKRERQYIMPVEFVLVGAEWTEWTPLDCLILIKFAFVNLVVDWQAELLRAKLAEYFDTKIIEQIFPGRSEFHYDFSESFTDEELKLSGLFKE